MRPGAFGADSGTNLHPLKEMGLLLTSAALFFLAFPSSLFPWGIGCLGFVALLPFFLLCNRTRVLRLPGFGLLAGFLIYLSFNYWLGAYHPLAIFIVPVIMAVEFMGLALVWRLARQLFPRHGFWLQWVIWVAFEFAKTQGFLGYPYGLIAYSQYLFLPLARFSSVTGIWGISALVIFPAVWLAWLLADADQQGGRLAGPGPRAGLRAISARLRELASRAAACCGVLGSAIHKRPIPGLLWIVAMVAVVTWGSLKVAGGQPDRLCRMVLVQQNMDPWIGGTAAYAESLERLMRQTDLALAAHPETQLVVWSETSFIPAIEWHFRYREDAERFALVKRLKEYLAALPVPVLLGNGEAEPYLDANGIRQRRDYNAAVLYRGAERVESYRKLRLVPFTEHFPYKDIFPWFYQLLVDANTSFWEAGSDYVLLEAAGTRLGTPICFEDSFGYISREFVNRGAGIIVNLTNDTWSKSEAAAMQHLAMASFRAMETGRSVVRSTNGGMSALIVPDGRIASMNAPFTESWLFVEAPIHQEQPTIYLAWGDWLGIASLVLAGLGVLVGLGRAAWRLIRGGHGETD